MQDAHRSEIIAGLRATCQPNMVPTRIKNTGLRNEVTEEPADDLGGDALSADDPLRRRLPPLLRRAWFSLNKCFRRRIAHLGLTPDQFSILRWLNEQDGQGVTQSELTQMMASDPNTIAALLGRMEAEGWIKRAPHEHDRRAKRIRLMAPGRRLYHKSRSIAVELQMAVLSDIPEAERETFLVRLETLARASERELEKS